ncbi:MAG: ATP-binding protein, partial [Saprospiraceae bacterium]
SLPTLRVIPFQFRQLFSNLLSNALKFAHVDRPPEITLRATRQPGPAIDHPAAQADRSYQHITVADNGIGFDPSFSHRIFEVFQRLHSRHEYSGTGIGLAICKKIVEVHHGFITAESNPSAGATFHIYLPEEQV